jgi:hypothetical protein
VPHIGTVFDTRGHNLSDCGLGSRSDCNTADCAEQYLGPGHLISTIFDADGHKNRTSKLDCKPRSNTVGCG